MTVRVLWALCLALGASVSGMGMELYVAGAGAVVSYAVVVAGIVLLPVASAAIERYVVVTTPE